MFICRIRLPMQDTWVQSLGQEDPLEKEMTTFPVFLPGKSQGQSSLVGYSPWSHKRAIKQHIYLLALNNYLDYLGIHHTSYFSCKPR